MFILRGSVFGRSVLKRPAVLLGVLFLFCRTSQALFLELPIIAALSFVLLQPKDISNKESVRYLLTRPDRQNLPYLPRPGYLPYLYKNTPGAQRLIFVIPGLGGHPNQSQNHYLMELLAKQNNHVVVVPSTMNWSFVSSLSETGLPGLPREDAKDLYRGMKLLIAELKSQGLRFNEIAVLGYSLGALTAAHLKEFADSDSGRDALKFAKTILINPPIRLEAALETLDGMYDLSRNWSKPHIDRISAIAFSKATKYLEAHSIDSKLLKRLEEDLPLTQEEIQFLIGRSFRESLRDLIFASQVVNDLGILKAPLSEGRRTARYSEIMKIGFRDYYLNFVFFNEGRNKGISLTPSKVDSDENLLSQLVLLSKEDSIHLLHNADDFLVTQEDLLALESVMGSRAHVFAWGSHLGNVWSDEFRKELLTRLNLK